MSTPLSYENTSRFHRVPVGFGPAPTPRQDKDGNRFDWSQSQATTIGVTYVSEHAALDALLPEGYATDKATKAVVLFEVMELCQLPWLAGRGYNTWGVYIANVVCTRTKQPYTGSYMAVLFESFTDPITTGREELDYSKPWAELPDAEIDAISCVHTACWFGTEFMNLEFPNLVKVDVKNAPALRPCKWTRPPAGKPLVINYQTIKPEDFSKVKLDITPASWDKLPTLWNVVDGLAGIPRGEVLEVAVQTFQGASDLIANQKVE